MVKHEIKYCPKCLSKFECRVGSIHLCQCWEVPLTEEERAYVKEKYDECLCSACLMEEKRIHHQEKFERKLRALGDKFK